MTVRLRVGFWNVENLYAPEGYPQREPWIAERMKNDLKGWTQALFNRKVAQLTSVIAWMNDGKGPDVLGVCEVENKFVLDELIRQLDNALPERHYAAAHADSVRDQRGIDTAFIYDQKTVSLVQEEVFSHWVMRRTGTRDITQCTFKYADKEFVVLMNHWPSRSGGTEVSTGFRMTAGETLGYWHERIREEKGDNIAVIAGGDFNDEPSNASLTTHANSTREFEDIERARSARFYNAAWRYLAQPAVDEDGKARTLYGTLYFDGNGNVFDQILVSRGAVMRDAAVRALVETARIDAYPAMVSKRAAAQPIRFGLPKGDAAANVNENGYADHYPVSITIEVP